MKKTFFFTCLSAAALSGCASTHKTAAVAAPSTNISYKIEVPAETPSPYQPLPTPYQTEVQPGQPIYTNPKIRVVTLAPHMENGRLFGPQTEYVVDETGHFNVDALRDGGAYAYIPAQNIEVPPGVGNPYTAPATQASNGTPQGSALENPTTLASVTITALTDPADKAKAEAMADAAGKAAVYDKSMSCWVLLPKGKGGM